jgi:hypothetical protein
MVADAADRGDDTDAEMPLSSVRPCSICASIYPICRSRSTFARPAGKTNVAQGLPHGRAATAVARGVDVRLG